MDQLSLDAADQKLSVILDEIESIGIRAETEGRELNPEEIARIETLSREFDACEEMLGHAAPGRLRSQAASLSPRGRK
jgi:hypothetical protein